MYAWQWISKYVFFVVNLEFSTEKAEEAMDEKSNRGVSEDKGDKYTLFILSWFPLVQNCCRWVPSFACNAVGVLLCDELKDDVSVKISVGKYYWSWI
jgi:hypothetical protein